MTSTIPCDECGAPMSRNALTCPRCRHPARKNRESCRVCGTLLPVSQHRFIDSAHAVSVVNGQGGTVARRYIAHRSCPTCGEPRPLLRFVDTAGGKALGVAGFVSGLIFPLLLWAFVHDKNFDTYFDQQSAFMRKALMIGVLLVTFAALVLIGWGLTWMAQTNKYLGNFGKFSLKRLLWIIGIGVVPLAVLILLVPLDT